jgi:hypothetical protein
MEGDDVPESNQTLEVQPFQFEPIIRCQTDRINDEDSDDSSRDSSGESDIDNDAYLNNTEW